MGISSVRQHNMNDNGLNLYKAFDWFDKNFSPSIGNAIQEFWKLDLDYKLVSIGQDYNFFMSGSEYFVTRIKLSKENQFIVKLSKEAVRILLDVTFGYNEAFEFEKITELEARILTAFNNLIYENLSQFLKPEEEIQDIQGDTNLAYFINCGIEEPIKIIISVPNSFLNYKEIVTDEEKFGISDFPETITDVNLYIGSTNLTLNDIKNIEKEDIIVLDNSNINNMTLVFENNKIGFKVSPDPSLIVSFDDENGSKNMTTTENIWDNIQVDITAEFEKVKFSLGEIKQISEGLVIDIGSVYENRVSLKVEDKTIATGELVIINDRYGVRIDEVLQNDNESSQENTENSENIENELNQNEQNFEENNDKQNEEFNDETDENKENDEFDYNDFDVDDENI